MNLLRFLILSLLALGSAQAQPHFAPQGFGGATVGGDIDQARTLWVTSLDDNPASPQPGTFRWAVMEQYPRIVRFKVAGDIVLRDRLFIRGSTRKNLTVDGSNAPAQGICIRNGEIAIRETEEVIFRHVRIRRGRDDVKPFPKPAHTGSSANLDCVELRDVNQILFDHVSFSWSCDELIGITHSQNVTFQWCLFAEPLGDVAFSIHPYGTNHSAALNISSSTVSIHHSLLANFRIRGPQFEANDVRAETPGQRRTVKLESVNNLVFNYLEAGGRYHTDVEAGTPADARFLFQFVNNRYFNQQKSRPEIWANGSGNPSAQIKLYLHGNIGPNRPTNDLPQHALVFTRNKQAQKVPLDSVDDAYQQQLSASPVFTHDRAQEITLHEVNDEFVALVLENAGARPDVRDAADTRIVNSVPFGNNPGTYIDMVTSPHDGGGLA